MCKKSSLLLLVLIVLPVFSGCLNSPLKKVWSFTFENSFYFPDLVFSNDGVYTYYIDKVYFLSAETGDVLWVYDAGGEVSSLITEGERVYFLSERKNYSYLYCLDTSTGNLDWKKEVAHYSYFTVYNGRICIYSDGLICLDAVTGNTIWSYSEIGYYCAGVLSPPVAGEGKVVIGSFVCASGKRTYVYDYRLYCFDTETGNLLWEYKCDGGPSTLLIYKGKIYNSNAYGVQCLDLTTGEELWRDNVGKVSRSVAADRKLYITPWSTDVVCLDAETGKELWRCEIVGKEVEMHHPIDSVAIWLSPEVVDKKVYTGSQVKNRYVYCLDAETGDLLWKYNKGKHWYSSPVVGNGKIYYATVDGIYCFEIFE